MKLLGWALNLSAGVLLTSGQAAAQSPRPVQVAMPEVGPVVRIVELTGSFTARRASRLSPRLPGLVSEVTVDAGDSVERGDVLVRLDARMAELAVQEAEAQVEERAAALAEARRLVDESRRLREREFIPETELAARSSAAAMAAAALTRAESALATAAERVERHALVAPFGGVIAARLVEVGEWVETGTAVAELVDTRELWLDVQAPQRYWNDLEGDVTVAAIADAVPDATLEARVHRRVPVNDPSARTFLVRLIAANEGNAITPGMSARARFEMVAEGEVVRVPRDALIRYPDGTTTVWVVDERSDRLQARELPVTIGEYVEDQVEILEGLERMQAVIVRGNEVLGNGDPVRVVNAGGR